MSYLKLRREMQIGVEVQVECQACGSGVFSEATEGAWQDRPVGSGVLIVVKVPPFCARCRTLYVLDERMKGTEINGANNREGSVS